MKHQTYLWPNGSRLALSIVVNVEEGAEASIADGDPYPEPVDELGISPRGAIRHLANESNYAYGIIEGFQRVATALAERDLAATWTAAAVALERAPEIATFINGRDDEVASHGYRWVHQFKMTESEERAFLRAASDSIEQTIGTRPAGHLSRYLTTPNTRRILAEEGFTYHMDDYSRDVPYWDKSVDPPIVVVPYAIDTNDMKMWSHPGYTPAMWLDYAIQTFDRLKAESAAATRMMSVGVHLRVIGRPGRIWALEKFLDHVQQADHAWIAHRRDIASHFRLVDPL